MLTNTRAMTSGYRLRQWADIMQKQKESGLNVRLFCREAGIKEQRYYYWQRKLREAANEKLMKDQVEATGLVPTRKAAPVVWAEINMEAQSQTSTPKSNSIKICRDGWEIMVEHGFDIRLLTETLRAVSQVC